MCGIVAYVGDKEAYPILIKGLPGNLVADNLDGIITNVFILFFV